MSSEHDRAVMAPAYVLPEFFAIRSLFGERTFVGQRIGVSLAGRDLESLGLRTGEVQ